MNIVNKLTLRQLKLNKKRTLVTIIGVIISVAMMTAVATLGVSYMNLMQRQTIANDGEWHVLYKSVDLKGLKAIESDENTKSVIISRDIGYAPLGKSQNKYKPYLFIKEYNKEGFEKFPVELSEGRFPQNPNEIVISDEIRTNAKINYKIGDELTLNIGKRESQRSKERNLILSQYTSLEIESNEVKENLTKDSTKTYTVVGIIKRPRFEPTSAPGYTVLSYVDESNLGKNDRVNASVILKKVNKGLFDHAQSISKENGLIEPTFNTILLRYYGVVKSDSLRSMLLTLSAIIMSIIMIGSVALIYNAFSISVSERSRHLGMLSSVGATKIQKRNSVFFEGAVIGIISIPLGIIFGLIGIGITFMAINSMLQGALGVTESFRVVVSPLSISTATIVSIITIFISTYIPARRASNISAIDAIRQTQDIRLTGKEVRTSKITREIFGIEGDIGLKNLKRNKGRYKATVFSLIISLVLFLAVTSFTSALKKSVEMSQDKIDYDINVSLNRENEAAKEDLIKRISSLEHITEYSRIDELQAKVLINKDSIADYLKNNQENIDQYLENGKYPYFVTISALDHESLQAYAKDIGIDINRLEDTKNPAVIVVDTVTYKDYETGKYIETKSVKADVGEKLNLIYHNWETDKDEPMRAVEIGKLTDKIPMGVWSHGQNAGFNMIVSKKVFQNLISNNENIKDINTSMFIKSDDPMSLQRDIEKLKGENGETNINIYNEFMGRQKEQQLIILISIFVYGFILLITFICIANIFNTISTSVTLRKREFAMLKSVGMTPESFNKMINYESIFYGIKSIAYGLPISFGVMYLIHRTLMGKFNFKFTIPWVTLAIAVSGIFIIVGLAMLYSSAKIKKDNIVDALRQEVI